MAAFFSKTTDRLNFSAKLSEDKLKLFIDVEVLGGHAVFKDDLLSLVKECAPFAQIHDGVLDDILRCLQKGEMVSDRRIAKGVAIVNGADGKLLLLVKKFTQTAEVKIDEKGYADYGSLHLFDNIAKGHIVGRLYPPKNGTDGVDALGNNLSSSSGKPLKLALDKSIILRAVHGSDHNYEELVAETDGFLSEESGQFLIKEELYVKNNLDYRFGSIDFIGKVKVSGDIMPGFNITAKKGIEILGSVRGGSLVCMDGDIVVKGFVYGGKDSRVICGKSFTANVVQEINAEIVGPIIINKEATDSNLRTESTLSIPGGSLVGGKSFAVCGVEAKKIGNEAGTITTIMLCSDVETHTEYSKLLANIESHERAKKMLELHLGPLVKNPERIQLFKPPHRDNMHQMHRKLSEVENSRIKLLTKKKTMLEQSKVNSVLRVNYLSDLYQGSVVKAGDKEFLPEANLKGPGTIEFIVADIRFEAGALKPLECNYQQTDKSKEAKK